MATPEDLPQPITNVPQAEVGSVVQRFLDYDQVTSLQVKAQADGTFTVTPKAVQK